jgi:catechol 2,3-dioxygenase-like lactoylglutathione lyase family enzyme
VEPRISLLTLGVEDLERSYRFYKDGLGLPTTWDLSKGVVFFRTHGTRLALYPRRELAKDVSPSQTDERSGFPAFSIAHNVRTREEVDALLAQAERAGARIAKPAQETDWGGYAGYFSDPDGFLWEVAHGAFPFTEDGSLDIP